MMNYICINGKKTELTEGQVRELGFTAESPLDALVCALRNGRAREEYSVHDTITVGEYELEIIGFDHDKTVDDPNAPTVTVMAKTLTSPQRWHDGACERGWIDSEIRKLLNEVYVERLPGELQPYIRAVTKKTRNYKGDVYETTDRLFIPSESEMFGSAIYSDYEDGPRYEAFSTSERRVRVDESGEAGWYWIRSQLGESWGGSSTNVAHVSSYGYASGNIASIALRVPVCFVIA